MPPHQGNSPSDMETYVNALSKEELVAYIKHSNAFDGLATFAQSLTTDAPEQSEDSNPQPTPCDATSVDSEMEVASESADGGFETVVTKAAKRKMKAMESAPPKAPKKAPKKASTATAARVSSGDTVSPLPAGKADVAPQAVARAPSPTAHQATATAQLPTAPQAPVTAIPRVRTPPPVIIQDKQAWNRVSAWMTAQKVNFTSARATQDGIKVQCPATSDHRRLTAHLREANVGFHTYALEDERHLRVVIKGIPKEIESALVLQDLQSQGFPVREVHRMYHFKYKKPYDSVLVILDLSPEGKKIFNVHSICYLTGLRVEPPRNRGLVGQCHRCQLYGHSARNCNARPRCVKCLGDHGTADCPRKVPDPAVPPSCVLCETQGHPANYRGCPRAPRRRHPGQGGRSGWGSRPYQTYTRAPAAPSAPQVYIPAPAPTTNAWVKPPTAQKVNPRPVTAHAHVPSLVPTDPQQSSDMGVIADLIELIDIDEIKVFADKLRQTNDNLKLRLKAIEDHAGLIKVIANYKAE